MGLEQQSFHRELEARFPGLVGNIRSLVEKSETEFTGKEAEKGGFLWEHSVLVGSVAYRLAAQEGEVPWIAALAALFHDAGKFAAGSYHGDGKPEEEESAAAACRLLAEADVPKTVIDRIEGSLLALYKTGTRRNRLAGILHDADFLSKSGFLGVANFFIKSALRGRNLERMIMESLSKELTYAAALPLNMRTAAGAKLAGKKAADTLRFHRAFLRELSEVHGLDFTVRTFTVRSPGNERKGLDVRLVMIRRCVTCPRPWTVEFRTDKGLKCEKLEASLRCPSCGRTHFVSFCLPEIA